MGIVLLGNDVVLTAGNSMTLIQTNIRTLDSYEIARLAVSPSVNELAQSPDGSIYLGLVLPNPGASTDICPDPDRATPAKPVGTEHEDLRASADDR